MRPKVILYAAISLDGRTTGFPVDLNTFYSLAQQWDEDATLVGSETLLRAAESIPEKSSEDSPDETVPASTATAGGAPTSAPPTRGATDSRPLLVVPDSRGRIRDWHHWKSQPYWRDPISLCTETTPPEHLEYLRKEGVTALIAGKKSVDFAHAFEELSSRFGVAVVRADSGGTLNGVLLRAGLVDELHLLVHPVLVGQAGKTTFFTDPGGMPGSYLGAEGRIPLRFLKAEPLEQGLLLLSYVLPRAPGKAGDIRFA